MKDSLGFVTFLAIFLALVADELIQVRSEPICEAGDEFFSPGPECFNFYLCRNGVLSLNQCPGVSLWDQESSRCAEDVVCGDDETTDTDAPAPSTPSVTTTESPVVSHLPDTEGALPILFPGVECPPDIRAFQVHETDCRRFYYCLYGIRYPQSCPFLQFFNFLVGHCVSEEQKVCFPNTE